MSEDERSLADDTPAVGQEIDDERALGDGVGDDPDPAEFVVARVATEGVLPGRRKVRLRVNLHLLPEYQDLLDQIDRAFAAADGGFESDQGVDDLIARATAIRDRMTLDIVVERHSPERVAQDAKAITQAMGLPKPRKSKKGRPLKRQPDLTPEQSIEILMRSLHAQIVEPSTLTVADLLAYAAEDPGEMGKLVSAVHLVNQGAAGAKRLLDVDFSRRHFVRPATPESAASSSLPTVTD